MQQSKNGVNTAASLVKYVEIYTKCNCIKSCSFFFFFVFFLFCFLFCFFFFRFFFFFFFLWGGGGGGLHHEKTPI